MQAELRPTRTAMTQQGQDLYERSRVGTLSDGRIIVPTNQVLSPAGRQVIVDGRPTDVAPGAERALAGGA